MMRILFKSGLWLCACSLAVRPASPDDGVKTLGQLRDEASKKPTSAQAEGATSALKLTLGAAPKPTSCPSPVALDFFKHEIAYDKTEELDPLKDLGLIHTNVWERGPLTAFYVDDPLRTFPPNTRLAYFVGIDGSHGYAGCSAEQNWQKCVEKSAGLEAASYLVRTCTTEVDLRTIPPWRPSPNDQNKRQVADELRSEIETKWPGAQEIVIRDFNLKDRQITMFLKLTDGDYFQGCGFHAMRTPHCEGWHLFGQASVSILRKWIFQKPYRLK